MSCVLASEAEARTPTAAGLERKCGEQQTEGGCLQAEGSRGQWEPKRNQELTTCDRFEVSHFGYPSGYVEEDLNLCV